MRKNKLQRIDASLRAKELAEVLASNLDTVRNDESYKEAIDNYKDKEKPVAWITMHGKKVPIFEGGRLGNNPAGAKHYIPRSIKHGKEVQAQLKATDKETFKAKDTAYQSAWSLKQKLKKTTDETERKALEERISKFEELTKQRIGERKEKMKTAKANVEKAKPKKMQSLKGKELIKKNDEPSFDKAPMEERMNKALRSQKYKDFDDMEQTLKELPVGTKLRMSGGGMYDYFVEKTGDDNYRMWSEISTTNQRYLTMFENEGSNRVVNDLFIRADKKRTKVPYNISVVKVPTKAELQKQIDKKVELEKLLKNNPTLAKSKEIANRINMNLGSHSLVKSHLTRIPIGSSFDLGEDGVYEKVGHGEWLNRAKGVKIDDVRMSKTLEATETEITASTIKLSESDLMHPSTIGNGVKRGEEMNHVKADSGNVNPNYSAKGVTYKTYHYNCQSCVPTYEMRRRGYDVSVMAYKEDNKLGELSRSWQSIWMDKDTGLSPRAESMPSYTDKSKCMKWLEDNIGHNGERYEFEMTWKGGTSGHVVIAYRNSEGKAEVYDPQNNKSYIGEQIKSNFFDACITRSSGKNNPHLLRIDDKEINPYYYDEIMKGA